MLITCDGPIDSEWVENISSVLDDNKRLSLQTGETIYCTPYMNIILEASRLDFATPATISRCAICYIRRETLPVKAMFNNWLSGLPSILKDQRERLDLYANIFVSEIIEKFFHPEYLIYPISQIWAINTFIHILESLLYNYRNNKYKNMALVNE